MHTSITPHHWDDKTQNTAYHELLATGPAKAAREARGQQVLINPTLLITIIHPANKQITHGQTWRPGWPKGPARAHQLDCLRYPQACRVCGAAPGNTAVQAQIRTRQRCHAQHSKDKHKKPVICTNLNWSPTNALRP